MIPSTMKLFVGFLRPEKLQLTLASGIKYFAPPKNYDGTAIKCSFPRILVLDTWLSIEDSKSDAERCRQVFQSLTQLLPDVEKKKSFLSRDIVIPERQRLRIYDKVPLYPSNLKPPKMQKRLRYMRGPELLHNTLQLKQYGVMATGGGRLRHEHFEMVRLQVARRLDMKRMFAIWRVDPPWQPITKKGQGQRMGGGKGAIDHYVTPVKAGRIIFEVSGKCEYAEVYDMLRIIAERLPFKAIPVSQTIMEKMAADEKWKEENNQNKYTLKYLIQNNMGGCHRHISKYDHKWYGKYV